MRRIIVTGANGAGKTTFARQLAERRSDLPLIHFDAMKLTRDWARRSRAEIDAHLRGAVEQEAWILEGGPSLLLVAMPRADALVWLDPPASIRAWRLAWRPWANLGRTRSELPDGNPDRVLQQYRFALRSLMKARQFREAVGPFLAEPGATQVWHCRCLRDVEEALAVLVEEERPTPPSRPR